MKYLKLSAWTLFFLFTTQVEAKTLLETCDFNHDGKINTRSDAKAGLVSKTIAKKESQCSIKFEGKKLDESIKRGKEDIKKLQQIEQLKKN